MASGIAVQSYFARSNMKTILLAEDTEDDVFAIKIACRRTGFPHMLQVVTDGEMAIKYLNAEGKFADRTEYPLPNIMFLDLEMPKLNGHQVLEWIRSKREFAQLPVVMLTSSRLSSDIDRAYSLGVTSYVHKKADLGELGQAIRVILKYWLEINIPPTVRETAEHPPSVDLVESR
jgi:CheY-like chemotaxis protein